MGARGEDAPQVPGPFRGTVRRALVLADASRSHAVDAAAAVAASLEGRGIEVTLERDARARCASGPLGPRPDLVVVLGGDGTVLAAARLLADDPAPVLGINFGRVGFLAPVPAEAAEAGLLDVLEGRALVEPRMRIRATLPDGTSGVALNDVVIARPSAGPLLTLGLEADGERVSDYRADGLILATPSGSTAYSLAAGGPVMAPSLQGIVATPISAHALAHRPLVLRPDALLRVGVAPDAGTWGELVLDGQPLGRLAPGESLTVARADPPLPLLAPAGQDPWRRLRERLGWSASFAEA